MRSRTGLLLAIGSLLAPLLAGAVTVRSSAVSTEPDGPPTDRFRAGETAHVRVEVEGFAWNEGRPDLAQDIQVVLPFGMALIDQRDAGGLECEDDQSAESATAILHSTFTVPGRPAGRWTVRVRVRDRIGGKSVQTEIPFRVEKTRERKPPAPAAAP